MDFIQQLQIWAKGDALQGKIMFVIGIVLALGILFILRGNHALLKGMLIPLGLLFLMKLGYGGFLAYSRPKHLKQTQEQYQTNRSQTVKQELDKANTDHKNYSNLKPVCICLLYTSPSPRDS